MNFWKDLYYDCIECDKALKNQIESHKKAIESLQKDIKKNEKFFEETFELSLDNCKEKSYNTYIKEREVN